MMRLHKWVPFSDCADYHGDGVRRIVTTKLAMEIKMEVALNHKVVLLPTLEFLALVLLGVTYRMSFCCK